MQYMTAKKNRLLTMLLTIFFSTVIFVCALIAGFGFGATAETDNARATAKYQLTAVTLSLNDGWIFNGDTPDSSLFRMVKVSVAYKDADSARTLERDLDLSSDNRAATGEIVVFTRNKDQRTIKATVTMPAGAEYNASSKDSAAITYTLSSAAHTLNGLTARYTPTGTEITTRTPLYSLSGNTALFEVYNVYNDGTQDGTPNSQFTVVGDLFPSSITGSMTEGSTYAKEVSVTYSGFSVPVLVTGIKFSAPDQVYGISGNNFQNPVARSESLDIEELTIMVGYTSPSFNMFSVPASAFPSTCFSAVYADADGNTLSSITMAVKSITLSFLYPNWDASKTVSTTFNNIQVQRISVHTPMFPAGFNATQATIAWDESASVEVSSWDYKDLHKDTGDAPAPQISVSMLDSDGNEVTSEKPITIGAVAGEKRTIEFPTAGFKYCITVTLPEEGDFKWDTPYNGSQPDNMTMVFYVQVDKGLPVVTLDDIDDTIYGTSNGNSTISTKIKDAVSDDYKDMIKPWAPVSAPAPTENAYKNDDNAWFYAIKYYTAYTNAAVNTPVLASNLNDDGKPKNCGKYYAVAVTYENGGYKSAVSNAVSFEVKKYTINTAIDDKTFARTDWTVNDFILPNDVAKGFPYGDTALEILDAIDSRNNVVDENTKFRHANEYTVKVEVKSANTANYQLIGGATSATVKFNIKTNTESAFDFEVRGWTYGTSGAHPDIYNITKSASYYPLDEGTSNTDHSDFEIKYYEYDSVTDSDGNTVPVKGNEITISDFEALEVGGYIIELIAKKDGTDAEEIAARAGDSSVDYTTVDYILPAVYKDFWVSASAIVAPYLDLTATEWALNEDEGGLLYTYDDTQSGLPFTFGKWIGDLNNTAADGTNKIITVDISYTTYYSGDTVTVTLGAGGMFTVNEAGYYTVKVTLNKNYSWAEKDSDNNDVWQPDDRSYSYNGYVARQQLTVLTDGDVTGAKNVYDSTLQEKTISGWNANALKITSVDIAGLETGHTPVIGTGYITTPNDNSNLFSVRNAGKYTVKVDISDKNNYEWAPEASDGETGDDEELTDEQKLRTLSLTYALARAPMNVTWGTSNLSGTFDKIPEAYPRYEFDGGKAAQSVPTAAANVFGGDVVTIGGYTLYNIADDNGTDVFGSATPSVTAVGHYRIVVSSIGGAAAANYYLPANDDETYITNIATVFEIYAKTLARPVLEGASSVTISGNDIEVVYNGTGYRLSDFIQDFGKYTLNDTLRLEIKCGDGENNPLLKNVLWNSDNTVKAYTITVKPAANYAWATGTADETLTYNLTITQKTVEISWGTTSYETTYGEVTEPTPTVTNAEIGDTVTIDSLGYKKGDTVIADITTADAGMYTVYAATLDDLNYKIDSANSDYSISFTIKKKALAKPTLNGVFANATFGTPVTASLYSNTEAEKAAWKNGTLFTAVVTANRDIDWFSDKGSIADNDEVLTIDTSDTSKYSFNTATGVLTYYAAGIYTVTFTLADSANYCWAGDNKETAFADNEDYTCAWNKELTNKRLTIDAPALDEQRAMEKEKENAPLSSIFTGITADGVSYGVQYGARDGDGFGAPQAAQPTIDLGQYYVLLTATDKYNYEWTVSADDGNGGYLKSSFISQIDGKVYQTQYTKADGAKVYLLYAITATQLDVVLVVNNYTYGDNGYKIGNTVIAYDDKVVRDYDNANGDKKVFDYQNHHEHVGTGDDQETGNKNLPEHSVPKYTFFKLNDNGERVRQLTDDDLVEGLPWEAGEYEAEIAIDFDNSVEYEPWKDTRSFTVYKRTIALEWTFGDETKQNGGTFDTAVYNGEEQKPTYIITNLPQKEESGALAQPQLTFGAVAIGGKQAFVDAATYAVDSVSFADNSVVNADFALGTYSLGFTIHRKSVTLTATEQTYTYGDSLTFAASDCLDGATKAQFYDRDGAVVTMRVQNATGTNLTNKLDVIYGGEFYLVPALNAANPNSANYTIAPESETVPTPITKAALTVQKRAITVTVTNTPTSVYSEDIASITYTVTRDGATAGAVVDSEADVFTIAARDGGNAVITNKTDVGKYYIILTINDTRGNNYDITFGTSQAADGAIAITDEEYKYEITPKQIEEYNNSIAANTLTYNGGDQKFLADGYAVVIGNPEIVGNAPVWSYVQTASDYSTDGKTFTQFTESPTVKDVGTYYFVIKIAAANHTELTNNIEVTVSKAVLTVKFDLTIMFGEENPASESVKYMFGLDKLRTENSGWTVTGFESASDRELFYTANANFYGLAGKAEYSVPDYDKESLQMEYSINFIAAEYDSPTLTCRNYTIVGEAGKLTVQKVALTVNVNDHSVTYNEQNINLITSVNDPFVGYTVVMPDSTYAGSEYYTGSTSYVMSEGSFAEIFTLSTDAHNVKVGTSTTGQVGGYAIIGTSKLDAKYAVKFVGGWRVSGGLLVSDENGTCGKYAVTPAALGVKEDIADYNEAYDEKWHGIKVGNTNTVQDSGAPTADIVLAEASDGTAVTVKYGVTKTVGELSESEFNQLDTLSDDPPAFRDFGTYYVHYCLSNPNYVTVIDFRTVTIGQGQNTLSQAFNFENNSVVLRGETVTKAAWTYGYKVENGFDPNGDNTVAEPEPTFKYASGNTLGQITFALFYNETLKLTKTVDADDADTVTNMFAQLFAGDGLDAGDYRLRVSMENTANYLGFSVNYIFKVDKRALTVKAAAPADIIYGSEVPMFTDNSVGLVVNSSKADATADSIEKALGAAPDYVTEYDRGDNAGVAYRVYVNGKAHGATDSTSFTNYTVTYADEYLNVVKRAITIIIADKENTYSLQGGETVQTLTFTLSGSSNPIYTAELDGGVAPENGVYTNANQTVLTLKTDAVNDGKTNNVILVDGKEQGYTIYAVFNDGMDVNYDVRFLDCALNETRSDAIGAEGAANNAGSYVIKQAMFKLIQSGIYHNDGDEIIYSYVYSGAINHYDATLDDDDKTRIDFTYSKKGNDGKYAPIDDVIDVGEYQAYGKSVNDNYSSAELTIGFTITSATLTLKADPTNVQYGTTLSGNVATDKAAGGAEATGRFDGFTYTATSPTLLADTLADYLEDNTVGYVLSGYDASTRVGAACTITPVCVSDDNVTIAVVEAALTVKKREVTVTMVGWNEAGGNSSKHNADAWSYYLGSHDATHDALVDSFDKNIESYIYIADSNVAFGDSGDDRTALGITISLPVGVNVGLHEYSYAASNNTNYAVTFANDVAPKFCVQKAKLTLYAHASQGTYSYTYGETIETLVDSGATNVGVLTYYVDGMQGNDKFVNLLGSRNIVFTIVGSDGKAYEAWKSGVGTYTVSPVVRDGENDYDPTDTAVTFQNYEIVSVVDATLSLKQRKIKATTQDQTFGFDGTTYNGGLFGKSHNAEIMFVDVFGNDANVDAAAYRPSFTLSYSTDRLQNSTYGTYQKKGEAPTVVGEYTVTVTLGENSNYVFSDGTDSLELDFAVDKLTLREDNLGWDEVSFSTDGDDVPEKFTNFIERYVDDYFRVVRFVYTSSTGDGTQIVAGDRNTLGTYYIDDQKLYVTVGHDIGTYTISFVLKDSALGNITLDSAIANEINVSFAVSQNKVTMVIKMDDFVYGDPPSKVTVLVNGGEATTGLTLTYAPVTSDNAARFAADSKEYFGFEKDDELTYGDLSNATNFNAGYYVLSAMYRVDDVITRRFYVFNVAKRVITAPKDSIAAVTFNGSAQNVVIDYNTAYMRPELTTAGGSMTAANGKATFTATAVGTYNVRFILIDPANNVWDTDSADGTFTDAGALTLAWNINKDDSSNGAEDDPIVEFPVTVDAITYGGAFDADLITVKNGYNGTVTLYRMLKTDDNMPAVSAEGWQEYNTSDRRLDAGEYWLKVVLAENRNFTTKATVGSFRIVPKTVTASVSGTMIYGTALADTQFDNITIMGLLSGDSATIGAYAYDLAQSYANLNAGGDYEIILATDGNDEVIGIDAGNNYIVKATRGTLTVTKRAVTVTIESKASDYSVTPVLTDVQYTAVGLADGEDKSVLGIVFETDATAKSAAGGTYWITVKSYDGTNYELTQHRALYVIDPLEIEVELVRQQNITYGDSNIKGATAGDVKIANDKADEAFVRGDLQLVIRFTGINGYDSFDVPTNAGTYTATLVGANSNYTLIGTPSVNFVIDRKEVDATAFFIAAAIYTGEAITPRVDVRQQGIKPMYAPSVYEMTTCAFTDAGSHDVTVSLTDPANYVWSSTSDVSITLSFIINKANDEQTSKLAIAGWQYGCYDMTVNSPSATVKSGETIIYQYSVDGKTYTNVVPENGNAGKYYVRVTVAESQNYRAFVGEPVSFDISKFVVTSPSLLILTEGTGKNDVYTGADLASSVLGFDPQLMQIAYNGNIHSMGEGVTVFARDAGVYTVSVSLFNAHNYCWSAGDDDNDGTLALTWSVARKKIAKPTHDDSTKIVNGNTLVYIPVGFDPSIMTIENNAYSYGGTFNAKIKLKDTKNYEWETGDDTPFTIKWSIVGADTVFIVIITVLSVLAAAGAALILVQFLLNRRRKRMTADTMQAIEDAEVQSANTEEGGAE